MCELHYIKPIGRSINKTDIEQLTVLLNMSWSNKDGFGITNGKIIHKKESKYKLKYNPTVKQLFQESKFLLGHNRISTNGKHKKSNSHPFSNNRFIWVHNGHIENHKRLTVKYNLKNITVDSKVIGELLLMECKKNNNLLEALKDAIEKLEGNFSVFIYDMKTKRTFYFKHGQTFQFRLLEYNKDKHIIVGSSDGGNLNYVYDESKGRICGFSELKYKPIAFINPKNDIIYEISNKLTKVGTFEINDTVQYFKYEYWDGEKGEYVQEVKPLTDEMENYTLTEIEHILTTSFDEDIWICKQENGYIIYCSTEVSNTIFNLFGIDVLAPIRTIDMYDLLDELNTMDLSKYKDVEL